jgi:dTDP-4-dehydrorhamnose 3,5-epimerase-like enzyme
LGRFNTQEQVDYVSGRVIEAVRQLRELSPTYEEHAGKSQFASD